jgi:hypothetical protein
VQPYQQQYIENVQEIMRLGDFYRVPRTDFSTWFAIEKSNRQRMLRLKRENIELLNRNLFPTLDELHEANQECIDELIAFADALLDWKTNLDCGVYVSIHEALLSLYRVRRDRNRIISELYKLGMGLYYMDRAVDGVGKEHASPFRFRNEMVFTEAGSYMKFFEEIPDAETRGYIIRALANIAICSDDRKRRVAITARVLQILKDEHYRALEPSLPWDVFLRRSNQQMSANRSTLSKGDLSKQELELILESCYEVFKPEADAQNPDIRWLWPYYEMEYSCGFVDLETTLGRMEHLIEQTPYNDYSISGIYANVQLAIYYGRLLRDNPSAQAAAHPREVLKKAYVKMMKTLMTCPIGDTADYLAYIVRLVMTSYHEIPEVLPFREVLQDMMQRFAGAQAIRAEQAAAITRLFVETILAAEPLFFNDIPLFEGYTDERERRKAILAYAEDCGRYHDLGLIQLNMARMLETRNLFETEDRIFQLHTVAGHDDLARCESTHRFADVALGHHRWYNGAGGYPEAYIRSDSPYRQMTDVVAVVAYIMDQEDRSVDATVGEVIAQARKRFSPLVTAYLDDQQLIAGIKAILCEEEPYYRVFYERLTAPIEPETDSKTDLHTRK